MVYRETVHGKYVPKVYGLVITHGVSYSGTKVGKHKLIESKLRQCEEWFEVKFVRIAPGVFVTDRKYSVNKLKRCLQWLQDELPGITVFLAKKPSIRVKDVEEEEVIPVEQAPKTTPESKVKRIELEWEAKITAQHSTWYLTIPKDVKERLLQLGIQKGSTIRVRFIAKVR
ncbi:MAG: hypothetical protein DRJ40_10990 [Thermoprotei archaeon]|nr:MAG: hypothetical protein DRJ40_10990 [Thermoprotei archaeon]